MEPGSSSDSVEKAETSRGRGSKLGSMLPKIEPFVPKRDHNPRELRSWAKRTGFVSYLSGETGSASSSQKFDSSTTFNVERVGRDQRAGGSSPKIEIDPILGRTRPNRGVEIEPDSGYGSGSGTERGRRTVADDVGNGLDKKVEERNTGLNRNVNEIGNRNGNVNAVENRNGNVNGNGVAGVTAAVVEQKNEEGKGERDVEVGVYPGGEEQGHGGGSGQHPGMKVGLRDNPGFG